MSLTIKVFVKKVSGGQEIRRFTVNQQDPALFNTVDGKIRQLYPTLANGNFQLTWKDQEGDDIVASSTEELQEAVSNVHDGVLRIYITEPTAASVNPQPTPAPTHNATPQPQPSQPKDKAQQDQQQKPKQQQQQQEKQEPKQQQQGKGPCHPGVTCDGCEGSIFGTRFKCCVCDDYDLCSSCEGKGMHPEHDMYKIEHPRPNPMNFLPPHLGRYIHRYMQGYMNGASATSGSGCGGASASASSSGANAGANADANAGANPDPKSKEQYDEYLKNVGANIAAFLDPFGIDVTYDVHHDNGQHQQGGFRQGFGSGSGSRRGCWGSGRSGCGAWQNMRRNAEAEKKEKMETGNEEKMENTPSEKEQATEDVPMKDTCEKKKAHEPSPASEDWTFVPDDGTEIMIPTQAPIPMPAPVTPTPAPVSTPTPVPAPTPAPPTAQTNEMPSASATTPQAPPQPSAGPQPGNGSRNIYPNLQIQQSLDQMLAMGFTNTDGWLSDLLTECNGDIGSTLDAIKAKATQQLENLRESR